MIHNNKKTKKLSKTISGLIAAAIVVLFFLIIQYITFPQFLPFEIEITSLLWIAIIPIAPLAFVYFYRKVSLYDALTSSLACAIMILAAFLLVYGVTMNLAYTRILILPFVLVTILSCVLSNDKWLATANTLVAMMLLITIYIIALFDLSFELMYFIGPIEVIVGYLIGVLGHWKGIPLEMQRWIQIRNNDYRKEMDEFLDDLGAKGEKKVLRLEREYKPLPRGETMKLHIANLDTTISIRQILAASCIVSGVALAIMAFLLTSTAFASGTLTLVLLTLTGVLAIGSWMQIRQFLDIAFRYKMKPLPVNKTPLSAEKKCFWMVNNQYNDSFKEHIAAYIEVGRQWYKKYGIGLIIGIDRISAKDTKRLAEKLGSLPEGVIMSLRGSFWVPNNWPVGWHKNTGFSTKILYKNITIVEKTIDIRFLDADHIQVIDDGKFPVIENLLSGFHHMIDNNLDLLFSTQGQDIKAGTALMDGNYRSLRALIAAKRYICSGSGMMISSHFFRLLNLYCYKEVMDEWQHVVDYINNKFSKELAEPMTTENAWKLLRDDRELTKKIFEAIVTDFKNFPININPTDRWGEDEFWKCLIEVFGLKFDVTTDYLDIGVTERLFRAIKTDAAKWAPDTLNHISMCYVPRTFYVKETSPVLLAFLVAFFALIGNFVSANLTVSIIGALILFPLPLFINYVYLVKIKAKNSAIKDFIGGTCRSGIIFTQMLRCLIERANLFARFRSSKTSKKQKTWSLWKPRRKFSVNPETGERETAMFSGPTYVVPAGMHDVKRKNGDVRHFYTLFRLGAFWYFIALGLVIIGALKHIYTAYVTADGDHAIAWGILNDFSSIVGGAFLGIGIVVWIAIAIVIVAAIIGTIVTSRDFD